MLKKTTIILIFGLIMLPMAVFAQSGDYGLTETAGAAGLPSETSLPTIVGNVIGTALSMIGVLFFVLMVYGGVLWMTARGDETVAKKALGTIIAASIGMVIILASYALTNFVFSTVAGGGGGGGEPTTSQDDSECLAKGSGFECKQIDSCSGLSNAQEFVCGDEFGDDHDKFIECMLSVDKKRQNCPSLLQDGGQSCFVGLCHGMDDDIVCCK
jgi:hypothetical protein